MNARAPRPPWRGRVIVGASLLAGASMPLAQGAVVELKAPGPIGSALVIASGGDDYGCYEHLAAVGTSQVHLGRGVDAGWCRQEIAVQAQDYGMTLDTQLVWTSGATLADLSPRVVLRLNVRVPNGIGWVAQAAQGQVDLADTLFNRSRAGITLSLAGGTPQTYSLVDPNKPPDAAFIGTGCPDVDDLIKSDPARGLYDPASVNVYYVEAINVRGLDAYTCYEWGASNVIYVSYDALDNILAHELGHALGLQYGNGHVNGLSGFTKRNLMYAWLDASALQDHWTAGQVYRMNADTRSVLNLLSGVGTGAKSFRAGVEWVCHENPEISVPCPPLAFEGP